MAVIRLQLVNTLCQKLNTPFADYGSMQYFVESTCKQTNAIPQKMSFLVNILYIFNLTKKRQLNYINGIHCRYLPASMKTRGCGFDSRAG